MIASRVVQVFAPSGAQGLGRHSSGVVLAPASSLPRATRSTPATATRRCACSAASRAGMRRVAWLGEADSTRRCCAAGGRDAGRRRRAALGRLVRERRLQTLARGRFPWARSRRRARCGGLFTEAIDAAVDPLWAGAQRPDGPLVVHVQGPVSLDRTDGGSPWEGMSGAALLRDDVVVGVIAGDPRRFGPTGWTATPASALAASPGFCAAASVEVADVELWVLEAPYRGRDDAGVSASPSPPIDSRAEVVASTAARTS